MKLPELFKELITFLANLDFSIMSSIIGFVTNNNFTAAFTTNIGNFPHLLVACPNLWWVVTNKNLLLLVTIRRVGQQRVNGHIPIFRS
jgi:hypothetical protein